MSAELDVHDLRRELLARLDAYPMGDWSIPLLRAVIGVIDLTEPGPLIERSTGQPELRVIR